VSNQPESGDRERPAGPQQSIKRRVIRLVLIPGVVALVLWLVASGYLVFTGFYVRQVANSVRQVSIPAVTGLAAIQRERRMSIAFLSHSPRDLRELIAQRQQTDEQLTKLREVAAPILSNAPESIATRWSALSSRLDQLAGTRSTIDSGMADTQDVYDFYNAVLDAATDLFDTQARVVPDVTATQGGIAATEIFRTSDLMSRAGSVIAGAFGAKSFNTTEHLQFARLVGAYHAALTNVAPNLTPRARAEYQQLIANPQWNQLVTVENAVIAGGTWRNGPPRGVRTDEAGWESLTEQVSDALINLTITQADDVSLQALRTGNRQLTVAALGSLLALLIAVAAIVWAVRQSQVLVDRALSVRLAQLGEDAAAVVDQTLPDMMRRLRRREKVDPAVELPIRDYGRDEIGQLAEVLNRSLHAAVDAAVDEANARAAGTAMLMGVARRPQRPLQRGLKVVEDLQNRIGDEQLLAELFDINHQLTQTRRFLENLIILAGGQTGRRFPKPVPIRRILLAAIAETQQYQRITLRRSAEVAIQGTAVAGTIHLLAELLDNALAFSPPASTVWISCTQAERGVVIEIEDAGVGIVHTDLERANELLASAPTPDVTELKDGARIGLWVVAELARREGVQVTLRTSAYGGVLAVVLLPARAMATQAEIPPSDESDPASRYAARTAGLAQSRSFSARAAVPAATSAVAVADTPAMVVASFADTPSGTPVIVPRSTPAVGAGPASATPGAAPIPRAGVSSHRPEPAAPPAPAAGPFAGTVSGTISSRFSAADLDSLGGTTSERFSTGDVEPSPGPYASADPDPTPPSAPGWSTAGIDTRPRLPQRRPQEHLAPELREDDAVGDTQLSVSPRSPEEARNRFASFQQGWRDGRQAGTPDTPASN
jgi:signal transduction histidine kinase